MTRQFGPWILAGALALAVVAPASAQVGMLTGEAPDHSRGTVWSQPSQRREQLTAGEMRFNGRFAGWQPTGAVGTATGNGAGSPMPANVTVTYPNAPFQQPGILQNMLQMRATSPRPDAYMGGAYNPAYQSTNTYPLYGYRAVYYRGYADPYALPGGYVYGGVNGYAYPGYGYGGVTGYVAPGYSSWGPVYLPPSTVIIQR